VGKVISILLVVLLILSGCATATLQMSDDQYLRFTEDMLEEYFNRSDVILTKSEQTPNEYWIIQEDTKEMLSWVRNSLKQLNSITPPEKYNDYHSNMISLFKALEKSDSALHDYSLSGEKEDITRAKEALIVAFEYYGNILSYRGRGK
jgi:uncharacterized protein YpbB